MKSSAQIIHGGGWVTRQVVARRRARFFGFLSILWLAVWSDWGAFKMEAYDATKYNVRILMEAGVTVSLHSDDSQIASRMNWEAG
jgi:hypothetical protein